MIDDRGIIIRTDGGRTLNVVVDGVPEAYERHREADALPTPRFPNWLLLGLLMMALSGVATIACGAWLFRVMVHVAIAVGGSV
jgi:hypothetical protein